MDTTNKKNILAIIITIVTGVGLLLVWKDNINPRAEVDPSGDRANTTNSLSSLEPFFDFGTVSMATGKVTHSFKVKNNGTTPVTITKIQTSCMCTVASLITATSKKGPFGMPGHTAIPTISEVIAPNQEATIEAVFDPAAHGPAGVGKVRRIVYVEMNGNESKPLELSFEANVTP